jgi:hypothetical protein
MASRARIGDVIEIATSMGLAYVQYSHDHMRYGSLIRALPGFFAQRPEDVCEVAKRPETFFTFYPVDAAVRRKMISIAGHCLVPEPARSFPLMRHEGGVDRATQEMTWLLWDRHGVAVSRVKELTDEQKRMSTAGICNHAALVEMITTGWTPLRQLEGYAAGAAARREKARQATPAAEAESQPSAAPKLRHYLYFRNRRAAQKAADRLRPTGGQVESRPSADGKQWLVLLTRHAPDDIEQVREELEQIAKALGGEYDGWEAEA